MSSVNKDKPSSALPGSRALGGSSGKNKEKADTLTSLPESSDYFSALPQTDRKLQTNLRRIKRVQDNNLDLSSEVKTMLDGLGESLSAVTSGFKPKVQHLPVF
jgi:hypothetical protein